MDTLENLSRRQEVTESLHSVVRTMKILSLTSIHQYEEAVGSVADYYRTVQLALQIAMRRAPESYQIVRPTKAPHLAAVVFGASRGMSGRFNEQLAGFVADELRPSGVTRRTVLALGDYVAEHLENENVPVQAHAPMPDSLGAVVGHVQRLLLQVEDWRVGEVVDRILLLYNRPSSKTSFSPRAQLLLPLHADWIESLKRKEWSTNMLPTFTVPWDRLLASSLREYLFVSLYRAYAESLAAEHSSRLAAMQSAEENVEKRIEELEKQFHQTRQRMITEELLDIVSGFEAIEGEHPAGGTHRNQ